MEGSVIIQDFLNYLKFEKRFSEHTAKCYGADLHQFGDFLIQRAAATGAEGMPIEHAHPEGGPATATQVQADARVDELLLTTDVEPFRAYMAVLDEKHY